MPRIVIHYQPSGYEERELHADVGWREYWAVLGACLRGKPFVHVRASPGHCGPS